MRTVVAILGNNDRQLEALCKAAGMDPRGVAASALPGMGVGSGLPDVLVVDTRGTGSIPPELTSLKMQQPELGIVIVAERLDPTLMLEAMRSGVNEFVAEPISQEDLDRAIARVLGHKKRSEIGTIYGFVGAKGGVGTTTVAVNVAAALSRLDRSQKALLIDMHQAGGDAALFMGAEPKFSVLDAVENTHRLDQTYLHGLVAPVTSSLDLLASSDRTFGGQVDPIKIRGVISFVASSYAFTILDLPRSDAAILDSLDQVTTVFVVANQELATVKSGARLAGTLRQRYGRDRVKMVMSRSDRQADIALSDVERAVGCDVAHSFPSDYRLALQALNKGRPLALEGDSDLSMSFKRFAEQLVGKKPEMKKAPERTGLFGRLSPRRA